MKAKSGKKRRAPPTEAAPAPEDGAVRVKPRKKGPKARVGTPMPALADPVAPPPGKPVGAKPKAKPAKARKKGAAAPDSDKARAERTAGPAETGRPVPPAAAKPKKGKKAKAPAKLAAPAKPAKERKRAASRPAPAQPDQVPEVATDGPRPRKKAKPARGTKRRAGPAQAGPASAEPADDGPAIQAPRRAAAPAKIVKAARLARKVGSQAALVQVAALPVNTRAGDRRVMLVTSRETRRWIVPKGWPMKGRKLWEAAAVEARQEAGLVGRVGRKAMGSYTYFKRRENQFDFCEVRVFALEVDHQLKTWREKGERRLVWMSPAEAAEAVDEPGLAALIRQWGEGA